MDVSSVQASVLSRQQYSSSCYVPWVQASALYKGKQRSQATPHVFAIADAAYHSLRRTAKSQVGDTQ